MTQARWDFHLAFKMHASILYLVQICIKGEVKSFNLTKLFWLLWRWLQHRGGKGEPKDALFLLSLHWHSLLTVQRGLHRLLRMMLCSPEWEQPTAHWLLAKIIVLVSAWSKEWDRPPAVLQPECSCSSPVLSSQLLHKALFALACDNEVVKNHVCFHLLFWFNKYNVGSTYGETECFENLNCSWWCERAEGSS